MTSLLRVSFNFSSSNTLHDHSNTRRTCFRFKFSQPIICYSHPRANISSFGIRERIYGERLSFLGTNRGEFRILEEEVRKTKKQVVLVRFNQGSGFNGGRGGGGWKVDSNTGRILGNLALAVGLTYLSMTGQLGWVLDAIVSVWLLAVILPIVGLGAFLWWAGRDIVQGTCPNCKNDFQIFKSMLGDELQLCPYCSQPFSVVGDKFVQDDINFSNQSTTFDQAYGDYFSPRSKKGGFYKFVASIIPLLEVVFETKNRSIVDGLSNSED